MIIEADVRMPGDETCPDATKWLLSTGLPRSRSRSIPGLATVGQPREGSWVKLWLQLTANVSIIGGRVGS